MYKLDVIQGGPAAASCALGAASPGDPKEGTGGDPGQE